MSKNLPARTPKPLKPKDARRLDEIEVMLTRGDLEEARELLASFTRANPSIVEGWDMTIHLASLVGNEYLAWRANRQLLALEPDEDTHYFNAAVMSAQLMMPFSALHYIETYLQRFPSGGQARKVQEMYATFKPEVERLQREDAMAQGAQAEDLIVFEESQVFVTMGDIAEGRKRSLEAARRLPNTPAPLNNLSLTYAVEGSLEQALKTAEQVLERYPDNLHARANRVQYLVRLGRDDEAQPLLDALRQETVSSPDHWTKILETLAYAGDEEGIIEAWQRASEALGSEFNTMPSLARHLAATAYARLGDEREAKRLWKGVGFPLAAENLSDLARQPAERNGPWYFTLNYWVANEWARRLNTVIQKNVRRSNEVIRRELERFFKANPAFEAALPLLLDRGDAMSRELVLHIASMGYPVKGLRDFALGKFGTDQMRMDAARYAAAQGEIDTTQAVTLYVNGSPTELFLMDYEVYHDPAVTTLPENAQNLLEESVELLYANAPEEALPLIDEALQIVPNDRTLLNQKAVALSMLQRHQESEDLIRHLASLYPDYLFARAAMAQLAAREMKFDEAHEWLKPLLTQRRFHISEFRAFAQAQSTVLRAKGETKSAEAWLQMLEEMESGDDEPESL